MDKMYPISSLLPQFFIFSVYCQALYPVLKSINISHTGNL